MTPIADVTAVDVERAQNALRRSITDTRQRELEARRAPHYVGDDWSWVLCGGCGQSATGSYVGRLCCTRCQLVVT
jgi:hypothetical protein